MKNIKMVVTDLDGTLLSSQKKVSVENQEAIKQLHQNKIQFTIASGRPLGAILLNLKTWGIDGLIDFIIHTNGYGYYDVHTGKNKTYFQFKKEWCKEVMDAYYNDAIALIDYDGYKIIASKNNATVERVKKYNDITPEFKNLDYFMKYDFPKFMITGSKETIDIIEKKYQMIHKNLAYHGFRSADDIFEFVDARLSKSYALQKLCKQLQLDLHEILAFGDSGNDEEMLRNIPNSVAMQNASDKIKKVVHFTTLSNDEHGVASFIEQNILGGEHESNEN